MADLNQLILSPAPKLGVGRRVAGPEEMQAIERHAREVQTAVNTLQAEVVALRARVKVLEDA